MKAVLNQRRAGVLLHITSLPSRDLGRDAYYFVDFLQSIGDTSGFGVHELIAVSREGNPDTHIVTECRTIKRGDKVVVPFKKEFVQRSRPAH